MNSQDTPFEAFPPQVREDIDGLTYLGHLTDIFSFCGHDFMLRTLHGDEELLATLVYKEYIGTQGEAKAHVWGLISMAIAAVDGREDFCPAIGPSKTEHAHARFRWATQSWYWPTALFIYNRYLALLKRQSEAVDALEDFCSGSLPSFTPTASSSTEQASSPEPQEDIRDYLEPPEESTPSE